MKRNLLIGILGGAAVGAAASYLWNSDSRSNIGQGLKNIASKAGDLAGGLMGNDEGQSEMNTSGSRSGNSSRGGSSSNSSRNSSASGSNRRG